MMSALETNFGQTPSQTVGPYFAYGLAATQYGYDFDQPFDAVAGARRCRGRAHPPRRPGDRWRRQRRSSTPWSRSASPMAKAAIPPRSRTPGASGFRAFGRCGTGTDAQNRFVFHTVKPGAERPARPRTSTSS